MKTHVIDRNKRIATAMRLATAAVEKLGNRGVEVMTISCLGRMPVLTLRWSPACKQLGGEKIGRGEHEGERYVRRETPYHGVVLQWDEPDNRAIPVTRFLRLGHGEVQL